MSSKGKGDGRVSRREEVLIEACKKAYRKHVLQDESIGWDELSAVLGDALACALGDKGLVLWLDSVGKEKPII